jgi:hypothetical protein
MIRTSVATLALLAATAAPAFAQGTAPAPAAPAAAPAASGDPIVERRTAVRAADMAFIDGLLKVERERDAKVSAAGEAAAKAAAEKGKDPLVAKRDAEAKARKAGEKDHDAKVKALKAERKAAVDAADKKFKAAGGK